MKSAYMKITFLAICFLSLCSWSLQAQTLILKSKSVNSVEVVLKGKDGDGHFFTKTLYSIYDGYRKSFSLHDIMYHHELYRNADMHAMGYDTTAQWHSILVYNQSLTRFDEIILDAPQIGAALNYANMRANVVHKKERGYTVTEVLLYDAE
jgi:hypothetical protein